MARFTTAGGDGSGAPGPQGPAGPAGEDAVLPQDLGTTDNPTFSTITLTSNGATDNITIGDDVILGDGNVANHVVIIGQQDATAGGIVLGTNETEFISTNGTDLSVNANNDIILNPGSTYAYLGTPEIDGSNRIATMGDIAGGSGGDLVIPFIMKDENGDDLLGFEKGGTGVTRINALQDDLALRSSNDIILYPGDDGPGNVYINWGDATISPDATNRVATIADIQSLNTGGITFVENTISTDNGDDIIIENKNDDGIVKARITLDQGNEQVLIEAMSTDSEWFNDTQWADATWSGNTVTINNTPDIINFFNNLNGDVTSVSINDGTAVEYDGSGYGPENIGINVIGTPSEDPLTVTTIRFYYSQSSKIDIDNDDNTFDIISRNMSINIDSSGDLQLTARDEDINLNARDDIDFTANWDTDGTAYEWRMTNTGRFELPGAGYISNPDNSSGDGSENDTLHLVPDSNLINNEYHEDQYLIIDPTSPNHIHIRAGGTQDESSAYLILGGEKTNVIVSDGDRNVYVNSRSPFIINSYTNLSTENSTTFTVAITADIQVNYTVNVGGTDYIVDSVNSVDEGIVGVTANGAVFDANGSYTFTYEEPYSNQWTFHNDGTLYGPTEPGWLKVSGIYGEAGSNTYIASQENLVLSTSEDQGVYINDANDGNNRVATIGDLSSAGTGDITFDGIQIIGAGTASGDGSSNGTIELVPDADLITTQNHEDQYIIIDPTSPNHIHIRAGGTQDASTAHLILGGEINNVEISDPYRTVKINTKPDGTENTYGNSNEASNAEFIHASGADIIVGDTVRLYTGGSTYVVTSVTQDSPSAGFMTIVADGLSFITGESYVFTREQGYTNQWTFGNDGTLYGPAQGGLIVTNLYGQDGDNVFNVGASQNLVLQNGEGYGAYLDNSNDGLNQIATIRDINDTVSTGMVRYSPTFAATELAFTGSDTTYPTYNSYYVKSGKMVSFVIEVNLSTVTNFGTGQYKLQLPFTPAFGFNHFTGWAWADPNVDPDTGTGHTIINADTAGITDVLDLHYLKSAGGANAPIREGIFNHNTPVTLSTISKIYVNGTYIAQ
jgi:hypothetical protein